MLNLNANKHQRKNVITVELCSNEQMEQRKVGFELERKLCNIFALSGHNCPRKESEKGKPENLNVKKNDAGVPAIEAYFFDSVEDVEDFLKKKKSVDFASLIRLENYVPHQYTEAEICYTS
jgi:hypothetical protein